MEGRPRIPAPHVWDYHQGTRWNTASARSLGPKPSTFLARDTGVLWMGRLGPSAKNGSVCKYDPLRDWLTTRPDGVTCSFEVIADLVGGLPETAYRRAEWWSNNDDRHVQAASWLSVGMQVVELDLSGRSVSFAPRSVPQ